MTAQCEFIATGNTDRTGQHEFLCNGCGTKVYLPTLRVTPRGNCNPKLAAAHRAEILGTGAELKKILSRLGGRKQNASATRLPKK